MAQIPATFVLGRSRCSAPVCVADAMVTRPTVHAPSTTVAELREFFTDDHVHTALLVEGGRLVGTVERADLTPFVSGEVHASTIAVLDGRTVPPEVPLQDASSEMTRANRRRLAVIDDDSTLLGLLCLKASGLGFCSDADATSRRCVRN